MEPTHPPCTECGYDVNVEREYSRAAGLRLDRHWAHESEPAEFDRSLIAEAEASWASLPAIEVRQVLTDKGTVLVIGPLPAYDRATEPKS